MAFVLLLEVLNKGLSTGVVDQGRNMLVKPLLSAIRHGVGLAYWSVTTHKTCWRATMKSSALTVLLLVLLLWGGPRGAHGRKGRGRGRTKSKVQIGLPITGQYRDPESDQYYNNNNGAKILVASHFDYEYTLGHKIAFMCVARGSPRPQITWFKDGIELYAHSYLHIHEWKMGEDRVKSKLEIDPATQMDAGLYECYADNMYSIDRRSFKTDFSIVFD